MMVQNGYGNTWTSAQATVQPAVSDQKATPQEVASEATQARSQEAAQGVKETQTQRRVQAQEQPQSSTASTTVSPFEQYQRTGSLSVYA
jgi:hypothetical protein